MVSASTVTGSVRGTAGAAPVCAALGCRRPRTATARIRLDLETGRRYYFGGTIFEGAPGYPDAFLRRYLAYQPGEAFSYARLGLPVKSKDLIWAVSLSRLTLRIWASKKASSKET